jgi:hypothetical protein
VAFLLAGVRDHGQKLLVIQPLAPTSDQRAGVFCWNAVGFQQVSPCIENQLGRIDRGPSRRRRRNNLLCSALVRCLWCFWNWR